MASIIEKVAKPTYTHFGAPEPIAPIFPDNAPPTFEVWSSAQENLKKQWQEVLGTPSFSDYDHTAKPIHHFEQSTYLGTVLKQPTSPTTEQTILLMEPKKTLPSPTPGMVIPFYNPDRMVGLNIETQDPLTEESPLIQFGRHLVEQGYIVVCTQAFPYNTVPEPTENAGFAWWQSGAEKLLQNNPNWTGMAKLTYDTSRALDLLLAQTNIDPERVGVMGHSLGGKMSFYAGCLDERFKAIVASDFGMGWSFTNWDAPWYLGDQITHPDFSLAHHQLLALSAPKPFFLFGGEADRPATWQYLEEARKVYTLYDKPNNIGFFDHASGHRPTEESLHIAYEWLAEQFHVVPHTWSL
ncbi:MAG: prolyl oligopeptidase family serine peptidase, partial [Candidatus Latescibacteria bacterium]|jgi:predicted esterase|nr:prolyl oligopeptidase family serine peptidase [Candidatus Latescibacterota bacterium]